MSERDRKIVRLLAQGLCNKQIAPMIGRSEKMVSLYRSRIMRALRIDNIAQLTRYAVSHGLTTVAMVRRKCRNERRAAQAWYNSEILRLLNQTHSICY
jgi:DNA-binding CsgD family transcriptional regulator